MLMADRAGRRWGDTARQEPRPGFRDAGFRDAGL